MYVDLFLHLFEIVSCSILLLIFSMDVILLGEGIKCLELFSKLRANVSSQQILRI